MRTAGLALVMLAVAVAAGCGAKTSSAPQVFRPFALAGAEAAAARSGTCLSLRMDGDPARTRPHRTRCAKHTLDGIYVVADVDRCPVQYNARRHAFGVVVCHDQAGATAQWRAMRSGKGELAGMDRNAILVRNVIVFGGAREQMRAFVRALRS